MAQPELPRKGMQRPSVLMGFWLLNMLIGQRGRGRESAVAVLNDSDCGVSGNETRGREIELLLVMIV